MMNMIAMKFFDIIFCPMQLLNKAKFKKIGLQTSSERWFAKKIFPSRNIRTCNQHYYAQQKEIPIYEEISTIMNPTAIKGNRFKILDKYFSLKVAVSAVTYNSKSGGSSF